ncbi:hypothetical protein RO575_21825 [Methylomonas sp. MO1]|uniref:hypothetical protein n=1 Tax=Methylomonas sp. MO1 TaxID=3073619 RepID=UPI0028A38850|nr:hypothetical protein [Methylomonas sp. MO1]MDT4292212.1 hypothetical protein [Methylomonas sp. MO1]
MLQKQSSRRLRWADIVEFNGLGSQKFNGEKPARLGGQGAAGFSAIKVVALDNLSQ